MPLAELDTMWAQNPCLFRFPCVSTPVCAHCNDAFTFFNGRQHCEFCGYVFHRIHCSTKCKLDGEFFRRRICFHCNFYRNVAGASLREGCEFTCYRRGRPTSVRIILREERGELEFVWLSHDVREHLSLESVDVQKGFSHAGQMTTAADYDPLKSLSISVQSGKQVTTVDLTASSAWLCQLWVDGLNAAKYVHKRAIEQASALELCASNGDRVYGLDSWWGTNYLRTSDTNQLTPRSQRKHATFGLSASLRMRCKSESPSKADDAEFVEIDLPSPTSSLGTSHTAASSLSPSQSRLAPHQQSVDC